MEANDLHNYTYASLPRRLMAALYDWLLVLAVMMVLSVPVVALLDDSVTPGNGFYRIALMLIAAAFFIGFWSKGGQTLGMKAWRLQLTQLNGQPVGVQQAAMRYGWALASLLPAGLGFLWQVWDKDRLSWHDRLSGTTIRLLPERKKISPRV